MIICFQIGHSVSPVVADADTEGPDAPAGRGFWGRMFPKRQNTAPAAIPEPTAPTTTPATETEGNTEG